MNKKTSRRNVETPQLNRIGNGLNKLEQTVVFEQSLCARQNCPCLVCYQKKGIFKHKAESFFDNPSDNSDIWLLKILNGLYSRDTQTIRIFIPDICFIDGDTLRVFHTDSKDNRIKKIQGTTPTKFLYYTMLKLKKQYKQMLQQKFQKSILNQIHPQFIHQKYIQHILPSYFNDGEDNNRLHNNKLKFMSYILHKDKAMLIQSIEQHKINQNQPFCSLRYKDGNSQLFSKKQFENYTLTRINPDVIYVQSYIKQKQQQKAIFTSFYSFQSKQTKMDLFNRAQKYVLILIGGIGKYSQQYQDIQAIQDATNQLMKSDIDSYILYVTYQIVHYLAMVARIYVKHIKINWVLNDLEMIYLQNIFQFQTTQVCLRHLKYRLPPKQQNIVFYKDSQNFLTLYKQIQAVRQAKRIKIRAKIENQKQLFFKQQQKTQNSTNLGKTQQSIKLSQIKNSRKQSIKYNRASKTISLTINPRIQTSPPQIKTKRNEDRYYKQKMKMPKIQNKKRIRYMSVLDKYAI